MRYDSCTRQIIGPLSYTKIRFSKNLSVFPSTRARTKKGWHQWPIRGKAHDKYGFAAPWVLFGGYSSTAVSPKSKYLGNPRASKESRGKNKGFARHRLNPGKKTQSTHLDQIWTPCWREAGFSSAQTRHSFNVIKGRSNVSHLTTETIPHPNAQNLFIKMPKMV